MTNQFAQPFQSLVGIGGFDYYTAGTVPVERGAETPLKNTLRVWDQAGDPKRIGRGEVVIYDFSQGLNHPEGPFSKNSNGYAHGTLVANRPNELSFPPTGGASASGGDTGNFVGLHSAYAFGTMFIGSGGVANKALHKQTSANDPTPTAITYSPAAEICSLSVTLASGAQRLAVGHVGQPVKLMSDASGTVASTMHTSTNSCWGIIMSGLNATTPGTPVLLLYCGTTIGTKASDADMTTAITTTQTGVNAGGFAIGAVKPGGRAQRAFWAIPRVSNSSGALKYGAEAMMDVWSTDMAANDFTPLTFTFLPNGILGAVPYRTGILMHDGQRVVYWDGEREYDFGIFRRRVVAYYASGSTPNYLGYQTTNVIDSDMKCRVRQLIVNGPECGAIWEMNDVNASDSTLLFVETYSFENEGWHQNINFLATTASSTPLFHLSAGGAPLSPDTRHVYCFFTSNGTFVYWYLTRPGESLLWNVAQGNGGTATTNVPVFNSGYVLGPRWWLDAVPPGALPGAPTIQKLPKVITEVEFGGNWGYSASDASLFIRVYGRGLDGTSIHTAYEDTFAPSKPAADYKRRNPPSKRANVTDFQAFAYGTPGSTSRKQAQLLPWTIRFAYSKDGKPITSLPEDTQT